jgi:hypothetical protein
LAHRHWARLGSAELVQLDQVGSCLGSVHFFHLQEVPATAVAYIARQVGVPAEEFLHYDWEGRAVKYLKLPILRSALLAALVVASEDSSFYPVCSTKGGRPPWANKANTTIIAHSISKGDGELLEWVLANEWILTYNNVCYEGVHAGCSWLWSLGNVLNRGLPSQFCGQNVNLLDFGRLREQLFPA